MEMIAYDRGGPKKTPVAQGKMKMTRENIASEQGRGGSLDHPFRWTRGEEGYDQKKQYLWPGTCLPSFDYICVHLGGFR